MENWKKDENCDFSEFLVKNAGGNHNLSSYFQGCKNTSLKNLSKSFSNFYAQNWLDQHDAVTNIPQQ